MLLKNPEIRHKTQKSEASEYRATEGDPKEEEKSSGTRYIR